MTKVFGGFDLSGFWEDSEYARKTCIEPPVTDQEVSRLELDLGYVLPVSYVEMSRVQNGGAPRNNCHRTQVPTSWAPDHITITHIYSLGRRQSESICGEFGTSFWVREWGYPDIGVYFASCPSAGHDMLCLDYRNCGPQGEPQIIHVDQDNNFAIAVLAENFETFIRGLEHESAFPLG